MCAISWAAARAVSVSVASAAVSMTRTVFAGLEQRTALLIGAGETAALAARHLRAEGLRRMIIANRSIDAARELAAEFQAFAIGLEDIGAHLPDLPEAWRAATVEQVMHHVSGIPDYEGIVGYDFYNVDREPRAIIEAAATRAPAFEPGERFEYSNTGYFLLSLIVERESGIPFERFLEQRIFAPLEMRSTYTRAPPEGVTPATGYHSRSGTRARRRRRSPLRPE